MSTLALALGLGAGAVTSTGGALRKQRELERRDIDIPWYEKYAPPLALGPILGPALQQQMYGARLDEANADAAALRPTASAGITAAAEKEMEAQQRIMRQEVGSAIEQSRIGYGQRGMYSSGARLGREQDIRQQGMGALATALAGIGLKAEGVRQQGQYMDTQTAMMETQLARQKQEADVASIDQIVSVILPMLLQKGEGTDVPILDPQAELDSLGFGQPTSDFSSQFRY